MASTFSFVMSPSITGHFLFHDRWLAVGSDDWRYRKALPLRIERKGIPANLAADFALLLVVHRSAFHHLARRISCTSANSTALAISRHDNSTSGDNLAIFLTL